LQLTVEVRLKGWPKYW